MAKSSKHYAVEFAERYRDTTEYLNAGSALWRIGDLIEDAKALKEKIAADEDGYFSSLGREIISYYAVGFVTCLEWHARSRLVDLLTFSPSSFRADDLKIMKDKVVVETLAANVTVASVVGAATSVSNFHDYLSVFTRLFSLFGLGVDGYAAIKKKRPGSDIPWVDPSEIERITDLFTFRHDLVHEIGIERVGHWNVRHCWVIDDAIETGELVYRAMRALEILVTANSPLDFPNVLDTDGLPTSAAGRLEADLPRLQAHADKIIYAFADEDSAGVSRRAWEAAKKAAKSYIKKEQDFIEGAPMLFNRYMDMKGPLRLAVIKSRYEYLKAIIHMVEGVYEIDDDNGTIDPT